MLRDNRKAAESLPFGDRRDFDAARRGFIAQREPGAILSADGTVVWDNDTYAFLAGDAPDTVHPSLWRQCQPNSMQGLHEVVDGIYQVRGFDLSNITFVEGDSGVVVIDPLTTVETARAAYMFGAALDRGPQGQVGAGLGQTVPTGEVTLIAPTVDTTPTGQTLTVDGLAIEFQLAPGTEAPAEMHFRFPRYRALCMAENANHTLHNLLTLRGALVRDPRAWARYLTEAIELFADRVDVEFGSHHWPTWGRAEIIGFLATQRDLYAYLHDQTLRPLNQGLNGAEIAERFTLPPTLENAWSARGYYGSVSHNVKAIYQRYMGWFDGGDFRWAATLLDHAVFAGPSHGQARELLARTLEQLGYGTENGPWRNFFLSGAAELRGNTFGTPTATSSPDLLRQLSVENLFDAIAIRIDGPKAWELDVAIDWTFPDLGRTCRSTLRNGVFTTVRTPAASAADVAVTLAKDLPPVFIAASPDAAVAAGALVEGDAEALNAVFAVIAVFAVLDPGDPSFPIVTP